MFRTFLLTVSVRKAVLVSVLVVITGSFAAEIGVIPSKAKLQLANTAMPTKVFIFFIISPLCQALTFNALGAQCIL